jgi:uncharacterized protein with von Willebrand factor type A (vWA) domain
MPDAGTILVRNWLRFGGVLRAMGFDAGPARMLPFLRALTMIDLSRHDDLRTVVRLHFCRRREEIELLDRVLTAFLSDPAAGSRLDEPASDDRLGYQAAVLTRQLSVLDQDENLDQAAEQVVATYSRVELLSHKDFAALSEIEMAEVKRLMRMMRMPAGMTRSRRTTPGGHQRIDLRRMLRGSLRFSGEPLILPWRRSKLRPRPMVLLCDISGSMERYSKLLLNFAYAIQNASTRVEAFVFATRLSRVTRLLRGHDPDAALKRVFQNVDDWSGGTRIGEAIEAFNRRYARRVLGHGATVVIISDGWDRGDPAQMRGAVERLQRACHRLIWMNPLLAAPGFEPLTMGLQAALPFVDDFLPAHNLASLEALGRLLLDTTDRRPVRRQVVPV